MRPASNQTRAAFDAVLAHRYGVIDRSPQVFQELPQGERREISGSERKKEGLRHRGEATVRSYWNIE